MQQRGGDAAGDGQPADEVAEGGPLLQRWASRRSETVRDPAALEKLPPDLRADWAKLWADVRALRAATAPLEKAPAPRRVK